MRKSYTKAKTEIRDNRQTSSGRRRRKRKRRKRRRETD
jgi:hypothetical protein